LGYSQNYGPITDSVENIIKEFGVGVCSSAVELGKNKIDHAQFIIDQSIGRQQIYCELESLISKYLGVDDSIILGMGFATNAYTMSALFEKGCLVLSDELNHASIVLGCRLSGAVIKVFKHNDMNELEAIVRNSIVEGQPRTGRPWKKIFVIVEGVYSMEGTVPNLPEILKIKRKYKLYVYLDEAHSIGAIGLTGRGQSF
jgi:serine palmitoyltransferase